MIEVVGVLTLVALANAAWAFALARRSRVPSRIGRAVRAVCATFVVAPAIGFFITARRLEATFHATETATTAADRQQQLTTGIAHAMQASAIVVAILGIEIVVLLALTVRYVWWTPTAEKRGTPTPYR